MVDVLGTELLVQHANSSMMPSGSWKYTDRTNTPGWSSAAMVRSLSSWLTTGLMATPLALSRSTYSSNFSGGTSNATWFIEPCAVLMSPLPGRLAAEAMPGAWPGAPGNQKKATESPLPQSKKKCWPPPGISRVLIIGMPSTFV